MSSTILLTGATGFIGFHILLGALEAGYHVRATVRSSEKAKALTEHPRVQAFAPGDRLSFAEVRDFTNEHAFDEAMVGVTYVIHVASPLPLPTPDPLQTVFAPIVSATSNLLRAALKSTSIERMVFTSSIVATVPLNPQPDGIYDAKSRLSVTEDQVTNSYSAYCVGKIQSLNMTHDFRKHDHPRFDIINILPGYTFGRNQKALTATEMLSSSNRVLLSFLSGQKAPSSRIEGAAHIDDVVAVHLQALEKRIAGNQDYGVSVRMQYNDAFDIVTRRFPDKVADKTLTCGDQPTDRLDWRAADTEAAFGIKFKDYEAMVVDTVSQYLDLKAQES
jgi:nucleoside-diphosphate-sugar epimerase